MLCHAVKAKFTLFTILVGNIGKQLLSLRCSLPAYFSRSVPLHQVSASHRLLMTQFFWYAVPIRYGQAFFLNSFLCLRFSYWLVHFQFIPCSCVSNRILFVYHFIILRNLIFHFRRFCFLHLLIREW